MSIIQSLSEDIQREFQKAPFPVDEQVYRKATLDPSQPILCAGSPNSRLCFFARDLGRDEVIAKQPLYGAAGRLVRREVYAAIFHKQAQDDNALSDVLDHVLLTNTVPYKPPDNKAYPAAVKKRIRPFLERLLLEYWHGDLIIPLGNEALQWFKPYTDTSTFQNFINNPTRYEQTIDITLCATTADIDLHPRQISLAPLPHPSPLNQQYYAQFPQMLRNRLDQLKVF
jgi:uracil-DNA glycosylase